MTSAPANVNPAAALAASSSIIAAGAGKIDVSWYQPKWQKNDYYQYNFRINYLDSVQVKYCSTTYVAGATLAATLQTGAPAGGRSRFGGATSTQFATSTGMLPAVLPAGAARGDPVTMGVGNAGYKNTCLWASGTATASAGPKNGAT